MNNDFVDEAKSFFSGIGVNQVSGGSWAITDADIANHCRIQSSQKPAAMAAYAAIDVSFAIGRFGRWPLIDMVDKVSRMGAVEHTALAMVCGASIPTFLNASERQVTFGSAVWDIIRIYALESCFEHVEHAWGSPGWHYNLRPRGFNWTGTQEAIPKSLKAVRASFCAMSPLQQIMVVTIMRLYNQGEDNTYLTGSCPTNIPAAEAMDILRRNGPALSAWGYMVTHYAGW